MIMVTGKKKAARFFEIKNMFCEENFVIDLCYDEPVN